MPKSTKAIKISDKNAPWNKKSETAKYTIQKVSLNNTILIVCEGQTEQIYFESFPIIGVEVKNLKGQSKLKLVDQTVTYLKRTKLKYKHIWCVFDMDVNKGEKEFADFDNAIEKARSNNFEVAYSNDALELWFYLHFNFSDEQHLRTFYYEFLGKKWSINYEKNGKNKSFCLKIYELLKKNEASQTKAISNAKKLHEIHQNEIYHNQNPITLIYKIVELLNKNLRT